MFNGRMKYLLLLGLAGCAVLQPSDQRTLEMAQADAKVWRTEIMRFGEDGDWLVISGTGSADKMVASATGSGLSHVGILDVTREMVVEAVSPTVRNVTLTSFLAGATRVQLIRPKGTDAVSGRRALRRARSKVGSEYDFLGTVGLPEKQKFYCSELAVWSQGMEVDQLGPDQVLHPASMSKLGSVLFDSDEHEDLTDAPVLSTGRAGERNWSMFSERRGTSSR